MSKVLYNLTDIEKATKQVADHLNSLYNQDNEDTVILAPILQGAVPFFMDIAKHLKFDRYTEFVGVKSYDGYTIPLSEEYNLTSTPLNEALSICNKLIPLFQSKYKVEKLSFVTLTDGDANGDMCSYRIDLNEINHRKYDAGKYNTQTIIKDGNKRYTTEKSEVENGYYCTRTQLTTSLLKMIKQKYNVTTIGFFLSKRMNRSNFEKFVPTSIYKNNVYQGVNPNLEKLRKQFTKDKVMEISKPGYDSYYVVNAKDMDVENFKLDNIKVDESTSNIKKMFSKSMKNRVYPRVLLNKFIEKIA